MKRISPRKVVRVNELFVVAEFTGGL